MQNLREIAAANRITLEQLSAQAARYPAGRDAESTNQPPDHVMSAGWNKGWGKYGKT